MASLAGVPAGVTRVKVTFMLSSSALITHVPFPVLAASAKALMTLNISTSPRTYAPATTNPPFMRHKKSSPLTTPKAAVEAVILSVAPNIFWASAKTSLYASWF